MKAFQNRRREDGSTASSSAHALAAQTDIHRRRSTALGGRSEDEDEDDDGGISGGSSSGVTAHALPAAHSRQQQQQQHRQPEVFASRTARPATTAGRRNGAGTTASRSSSGTRTPPPQRRGGAEDESGRAYASSSDDDGGASIASGSTSSGSGETPRRRHEPELGTWHYMPLLFVVLPVVAGAVVGRGDAWRDLLVLGLVGYWVYWLIKTPWELYHASLHLSLLDAEGASSPLAKDHVFYLLLTVASPVLGAFLLTLTRSTLTYIPSYLSPSSIRLFLLAALIKPVSNVVGLLRDRTAHLKAAVSAPKHDEAELLRRKLRGLEREVKTLRHEAASRKEVTTLREDVYAAPGGLVDLGRHVKRVERRAELGRLTLGERLELVQRGLLGLRDEVEDERERQGYAFGQWVLQLLRLSSGGERGQIANANAGSKGGGHMYSPAVAAAGLMTPRTRQLAGDGTAAAPRVSVLPPSWSPPPQQQPLPQKAPSGPLALTRLLVRSALTLARTAVAIGIKLFFWPVLLARWAFGQFVEVVRAG